MPYKNKDKKKEYQKEYYKKWYKENKAKKISQMKVRQKEILEWFEGFQKEQKCCRCGFSDYRALVYHHKKPVQGSKKPRIRNIVRNSGWSINRLMKYIDEEIDILCANCHNIHHYDER